jgi:phosphatidylglycerol---prolipoprotein diacylglyceryl transferase
VTPIPTAFHIGPLEVHTYGIGLAITFWFAYRYYAKRLRDNGYAEAWLGRAFVWIIVSSIVGARAVHVIANWGVYSRDPGQILAIWNGGLTSFGGLALAFPVGMYMKRKYAPEIPMGRAIDLLGPVLVAAWAMGRLLGPQLMVAGGGKPTTAWYGMYYAQQAGKRLPVPLFQAIECFVIFLIVLQVEKWCHRFADRPIGTVMAASATLWGLSRFVDERFWLTQDNGTDAVEVISLVFVGLGLAYIAWTIYRDRRKGLLVPPAAAAVGVALDGSEPGAVSVAGDLDGADPVDDAGEVEDASEQVPERTGTA